MNKSKVVEYLIGMTNTKKAAGDILIAIEDAIQELEVARSAFDNVNDPKLIEVAIYSEEVAKRRYEYLLGLAKSMGITVSNQYVLDQCAELAE